VFDAGLVIAGFLVALLLGIALGWLLGSRKGADRDALAAERDDLRAKFGAAIGDLAAYTEKAKRVDALSAEVAALRETATADARALSDLRARAEERDRAYAEREAQLLKTGEALRLQFEQLAGETLQKSQRQFIEMANETLEAQRGKASASLTELIAPMKETLARYEVGLKDVEKAREQAYGQLSEQLKSVVDGQASVSREAANLVTALRSSGKTAGSWGEQQLRNTLEMAGLREGIDFTLQTHAATDDGGKRPDAILRLPGGRELIVDSKCSMKDYLAAGEASDADGQAAAMKRHTLAVRAHAKGLSEKAYWDNFGKAADFVVMFMPGENFLSAALEHDVDLIGWTFERKILLCGPINLLAIAKIVAMVWRQEKLAEEARAIGDAGGDLYAALATMTEKLAKVGANLDTAVKGYDEMVASLEGNVLPKARRLKDLGVKAGAKAIPDLTEIGKTTRKIVKAELLPPPPLPDPEMKDAAE
jgi:DNA recombination protein RmuC